MVGLVVALMDNSSQIPYQGMDEDSLKYPQGTDFAQITPLTARQTAADFQRTVLGYFQKPGNAGRSVVVFCEDGCNLTGYCIVSFLHQVFTIPLDAALNAFADVRPPGIFHIPYLHDLHALYGSSESCPPLSPPIPDWAAAAEANRSHLILTPRHARI